MPSYHTFEERKIRGDIRKVWSLMEDPLCTFSAKVSYAAELSRLFKELEEHLKAYNELEIKKRRGQ